MSFADDTSWKAGSCQGIAIEQAQSTVIPVVLRNEHYVTTTVTALFIVLTPSLAMSCAGKDRSCIFLVAQVQMHCDYDFFIRSLCR